MSAYLIDSLIISNPAISDNPKFSARAGSAIYIVEHTAEGVIGVGLNIRGATQILSALKFD